MGEWQFCLSGNSVVYINEYTLLCLNLLILVPVVINTKNKYIIFF